MDGLQAGSAPAIALRYLRANGSSDVTEFVDVCEALGVEPLAAFARYLGAREVPSA